MNAADATPPAELEERLRFEVLLTELLASFVNIPADKVDGAIEKTQQRICQPLGLDSPGRPLRNGQRLHHLPG
jgi:hypothetical protein